jgi:hypothetical protein
MPSQINVQITGRINTLTANNIYLKSKVPMAQSVSYIFTLRITGFTLFFTYLYQSIIFKI